MLVQPICSFTIMSWQTFSQQNVKIQCMLTGKENHVLHFYCFREKIVESKKNEASLLYEIIYLHDFMHEVMHEAMHTNQLYTLTFLSLSKANDWFGE